MSPSATSPPVMQTAGRPPPYRVYDAAVSDVRTGVPHDRRMPPSRRSPFMPCAQCPFSGCGMVAMNSSVALYDDPVFHGAVLALHRRLKSAVRRSFGLGALRQSCFSCSLCAASSVSPCAVALAVRMPLTVWVLLAVWLASRSGWRCLYSAASSGPYPCRLHAPAGSR